MAVLVNASGNAVVDAELWGYKWDALNLTYSFPADETGYGGYAAIFGFQQFSTAQQTAIRTILGNIASFCNLTFTEDPNVITSLRYAEAEFIDYTDNAADAQMTDLHGPGGGVSAEACPPENAFGGVPPMTPVYAQGDSWYTHGNYEAPAIGSFAYAAGLMHETGHALGLKHGHITQSGHGHTFPALAADMNSYEFSIMTYSQFPGADTTSGDNAPNHPTTYMMADIAALQYLYGANYTTNSGNTTYTWNKNTGAFLVNGVQQFRPNANFILQTVWDGGGVDTYDFSSYTTALNVDLNPGKWANLGTQLADLGNSNGGAHYIARGNVFNALQDPNNPTETASLIENAKGGSNNDVIRGNTVANTLTGNGGNDTLAGNGGNDTLVGGAGTDKMDGGGGVDRLEGGVGNDIYLNPTGDTIVEAAGTANGNDTVQSNVAFSLAGGATANIERLQLTGTGNIAGTGNALANFIQGNGGNNLIRGGTGKDSLEGGGGNDTLAGEGDNDKLTGGTGADLFRFANAGAGSDSITDFNQAQGDRFDLSGGTFTSATVSNGNTVLHHTGGTIIVVGITNLTLNQWRALSSGGTGPEPAQPEGAAAARFDALAGLDLAHGAFPALAASDAGSYAGTFDIAHLLGQPLATGYDALLA
ncbi:MAG: M10 family metallopeptidase C-terminal domain-containing protein [Alphaproteobacteria bacterium]|nr:M10 family metallopeptidase C-terminal domain-containing protein [Alphaproteobacteria bacterium]